MCPKCLIDQLVGVLKIYMDKDKLLYHPYRGTMALGLIEEAKAMSHRHDDMIPAEEAEEASRT